MEYNEVIGVSAKSAGCSFLCYSLRQLSAVRPARWRYVLAAGIVPSRGMLVINSKVQYPVG